MTAVQMGLTIAVCTAATMLTRFLPFVVFSSKDQQPPEVVRYLGENSCCGSVSSGSAIPSVPSKRENTSASCLSISSSAKALI